MSSAKEVILNSIRKLGLKVLPKGARLLKKGYSLANVSKLTGTAINTLRKVKKIA